MKNPTRFLCSSIAGQPLPEAALALAHRLIAAGGLCAAAALVFVWADGSPGRGTAKPTGMAHPGGEKASGAQPNGRTPAADPARALAQAFALDIGSERESRIRDLLCAWATRDAEAALSWVSALENPAAQRSARSTVCLAVAEKDPRRAVGLALAHGTDEEDDCGLLECLTLQWCEKESEAALDWAREQPPGEWRERLLGRVSFVLSKSDPAAAARLVAGLEPGTVQDEAAMAVLHQWALKDPTAALKWAQAFSQPILRERALAEISNLRNLAASLQEVR
ncbi:MAG: hypothetical protein ABI162_16915 [Luteolibacter sp.]